MELGGAQTRRDCVAVFGRRAESVFNIAYRDEVAQTLDIQPS